MSLVLLAAASVLTLMPSTTALSRRAAVVGGCAAALLHRHEAAAAPISTECLSCRLKDRIAVGNTQLAIGTDVGEALLAAPAFAVKEVIDVGSDPSKFDATMRSTLSKYDPDRQRVLVWVQSELVDGIPWCPDTRAALPLLESALNRARGDTPIVLVVADVVRRDYYMSAYPYRTSAQLRLGGVPTLYRWGRDGPIQRLQERQITPESLDALIA
eukprot:2463548-Prymnesium_polylepis.1